MATKSSAVMGSLNIPNVPPVAPAWPSALVVAQQSVRVTVLKPADGGYVLLQKQDAAKHQSPTAQMRRRKIKRAQRSWL